MKRLSKIKPDANRKAVSSATLHPRADQAGAPPPRKSPQGGQKEAAPGRQRSPENREELIAFVKPAGPVVRLLPYQQRWLADDSPLKIVVKARQIGFSQVLAAEAYWKAIYRPPRRIRAERRPSHCAYRPPTRRNSGRRPICTPISDEPRAPLRRRGSALRPPRLPAGHRRDCPPPRARIIYAMLCDGLRSAP